MSEAKFGGLNNSNLDKILDADIKLHLISMGLDNIYKFLLVSIQNIKKNKETDFNT